MNKPVKAVVAIVKIGDMGIEGLQFPDGSFGVGVPQIQKLFDDFLTSPNVAARNLQRLMGKNFKTSKAKTEFNKNVTNSVTLQEFEIILAKLDRAGSIKAQNFRDELIGLSLQQLWSDAFDVRFEKEQRQQWLQSRQQSKITRRTFTDAIADYIKRHPELSDNYKKFIYSNCSDCIYRLVFGRSAKKLKEDWCCGDVREALEIGELMVVMGIEDRARMLVDQFDIEPLKALKDNRVSSLITVSSR